MQTFHIYDMKSSILTLFNGRSVIIQKNQLSNSQDESVIKTFAVKNSLISQSDELLFIDA